MNVFVAHRPRDEGAAIRVTRRLLAQHAVEGRTYALENGMEERGEELAERLLARMAGCTHLLAIASPTGQNAHWVLLQVGLAAGQGLPLATFCESHHPPPYLAAWPCLRSVDDIDRFIEASQAADEAYENFRQVLTPGAARVESVRHFYAQLRDALRVPHAAPVASFRSRRA